MQNYMETILSALKLWIKDNIKNSVADWDQTDTNAANYIKNKPFYKEEKTIPETIILSEYTSSEQESDSGPFYHADIPLTTRFIPGEKYLVIFNGEPYECICFPVSAGEEYSAIGNQLFFDGPDTGEPFAIDDFPGDTWYYVNEPGTYTFSIIRPSFKKTIIHSLKEPQYIEEAHKKIKHTWLSPTEFPYLSDTEIEGGPFVETPAAMPFQEGGIYLVAYDDKYFTCVAKKDQYNEIYIGNPNLAKEFGWSSSEEIQSNNEPFFYFTHEDKPNTMVSISQYDATVSISLIGIEQNLDDWINFLMTSLMNMIPSSINLEGQ